MTFMVLSAILAMPGLMFGPAVPVSNRVLGALALLGVLVCLLAGTWRRHYQPWLDALLVSCMFVFMRGFHDPSLGLGIAYFGIWLRGLNGRRTQLVTAAIGIAASFDVFSYGLAGTPAFQITQTLGLVGTAFVAFATGASLAAGERTLHAQRNLTVATTRLVAVEDEAALAADAASAILALDPRLDRAMARVGGQAVVATRSSGRAAVSKAVEDEPAETRSWITVPVTVGGTSVGALAYPFVMDAPSPALESLAATVGLCLMRIRLSDNLRHESDAKSQFLATMSHELRTPLTSVLGFAELLASQLDPSLTVQQRRYLSNIQTGGHHLLAIVSDTLDSARVAANEVQMTLENVSVAQIAGRAIEKISPLADAKKLQVSSDIADGYAFGDALRVEQVLLNLLANAVKFTPVGGSICVSSRETADAVQILVADTGIGIPLEYQSRIFEPFMQVEASRDRASQGTGLGLSLSRRLAAAMGGEISVASSSEGGSVFTVTLPHGLNQADSALATSLSLSVNGHPKVRTANEKSAPVAALSRLGRLPRNPRR
jgi:signal transduction histidine kinase